MILAGGLARLFSILADNLENALPYDLRLAPERETGANYFQPMSIFQNIPCGTLREVVAEPFCAQNARTGGPSKLRLGGGVPRADCRAR